MSAFEIPSALTVRAVANVAAQLALTLEAEAELTLVDARFVESIDIVGVQLLLSLASPARKIDVAITPHGPVACALATYGLLGTDTCPPRPFTYELEAR